jgi:hypothetical protein
MAHPTKAHNTTADTQAIKLYLNHTILMRLYRPPTHQPSQDKEGLKDAWPKNR